MEDNQFNTSSVDTLTICKARKKEGFYVCPVKGTFTIVFERSHILAIKETSSTLILKCKNKTMTRYMDDLNNKILDIVKNSTSTWFNSRIDDDLIDEYFISTLQYDKRQGETIRLKIKNIDEIEEAKDIDSDVMIVLAFKGLKFYKQKFFPEFHIELVEALESENLMFDSMNNEDDLHQDDEHPLPLYEEVMLIKEECLKSLRKSCDDLAKQMHKIELLYNNSFEKLTTLDSCENINEIIKLCEDYQKTLECE